MDTQQIVQQARNIQIKEIVWGDEVMCYAEEHINKEVFLRAIEMYHGIQLGIYDDQIECVQHEKWTSHGHCENEACDECGGEAASYPEYWIITSENDEPDKLVTILRYE